MIDDKIFNQLDDGMKISVYCKNLTNGNIQVSHNENLVHQSASVIKVLIMAEALIQVEEGIYSLYQMIKVKDSDIVPYSVIGDLDIREYTYKDLVSLMIEYSDNTATNVLIDLLGMEKINLLARRLSMSNTILQRKMMDFRSIGFGKDNFTTIMDITTLFEAFENRVIVCDKLSELAIDILKRQKHKDAFLRFLNEDVVVAHKTGQLEGLNHDIGIFYLDNVSYILGIFISNGENNSEIKDFIGRTSEMFYRHFKLTSKEGSENCESKGSCC